MKKFFENIWILIMTVGFLIAAFYLGLYILAKEIFKGNEKKGGTS
jgi:hypothetical protein